MGGIVCSTSRLNGTFKVDSAINPTARESVTITGSLINAHGKKEKFYLSGIDISDFHASLAELRDAETREDVIRIVFAKSAERREKEMGRCGACPAMQKYIWR
jgi:hypothetical protein